MKNGGYGVGGSDQDTDVKPCNSRGKSNEVRGTEGSHERGNQVTIRNPKRTQSHIRKAGTGDCGDENEGERTSSGSDSGCQSLL